MLECNDLIADRHDLILDLGLEAGRRMVEHHNQVALEEAACILLEDRSSC